MATIDATGKVAYMYDDSTDTFHAINGITNTAASYEWSSAHTFASTVTFEDVVKHEAGANNFQNPAARDTAIPSPSNGVVSFIRQDSSGNIINQVQYYYNGLWCDAASVSPLINKTVAYTLTAADAGRVITVDASSERVITIPAESTVDFPVGQKIYIVQTGAGQASVTTAAGVTLNSYQSHRKTAGQYARIELFKIASDSWLLFGDLSS